MRTQLWLLLAIIAPASVFAKDIEMVGTIHQKVGSANRNLKLGKATEEVTLMKVSLSHRAQQKMLKRFTKHINFDATVETDPSSFPAAIHLGMENVPVLNQGIHGSCVTFAASAAVDAVLKKGDYVSPLCSLQLGQYFQNNGFLVSGWDGSLGGMVLAQMDAFGFMSKQDQKQFGCGGLNEYPTAESDIGHEMSPPEFHMYAQPLVQNHIAWSSILDIYQSMKDDGDSSSLLQKVKASLNNGDRVIFGVLLADYEKGLAGAVGTHEVFNDTWVVTPEIISDMRLNPQFAGHEMIIMGYDDNATAKDDHGRIHKGILKLRNSWGERIGDQGNFYMSYDYFKRLVIEMQRIRSINVD
jgi:Peptidase C1-like family